MAAKATVQTKNIRVKFWDQSFQIDGFGHNIWLGRKLDETDRKMITSTLQRVHDRARLGAQPVYEDIVYHTPETSYLVNEVEMLKDEIQTLQSDLANMTDDRDWWKDNATPED